MELALARPILKLQTCAEAFGARMQPPLENLRAAVRQAAAIEAAEPRSHSLIHPLHALLDTLDEASDALVPSDVLFHHIALISVVASTLVCFTTEDGAPIDVIEAAKEEATEPLNALRSMSHPSNAELAEAAEGVFDKIMDYVKDNLSSPLIFVGGEEGGEEGEGTGGVEEEGNGAAELVTGHTAPHLMAYRSNVLTVVDVVENAAKEVGGVLVEQVGAFCEGLRAVYGFIVKASEREKAPGEEERQTMLQPIIGYMGKVAAVGEEISARDPLFNHVKAVEDAVGMISWIVAESKPTGFVSDAESTADFYLNKVLMATKKDTAADKHKAFVEGLRNVFKVNREYIKEYHTMGLRYGLGLEAKGGVELASSTVTGAAEDEDEGETYVSAFQALIDGPLVEFVAASKSIGGEVAQQAEAFAAAWKAEKEFLGKAYGMNAPEDVQPMLAPIAAKMADVSAIVERVDPRGPFAQHCNAVGESVAALGWVAVDEKATGYVGDMAAAGQFFMDKVKMGAKKTDKPDAHRSWAKSLETLFAQLKAYVKEYHTQKLIWNPPKVAKVKKRSAVGYDEEDSGASDYVSAFQVLIDGPLAEFVKASNAIGGEVAEQAGAFAGAWNAEAEFLAKAISMPKPDDFQDMLAPIAAKMGEVAAVVEKVDPRGPFAPHCNAVGESVAALGWVAVDEKATGYVGDMAGAGQFFLDKVKMGARKSDNPDAQRAWTAAVEKLFADLKAYVKEYHTQKLVWNPPKVKKTVRRAQVSQESDDTGTDYVQAFKALIDGPLAAYVQAANKIGGEVAEQATSLDGAWKAEGEFLVKAFNMPQPNDIQEMLGPIAAKMGEVSAIAEKVDPRGALAHHCTAVSESMAALGWVAVDEKATSFVGDMAGAGQFFIDKVKMNAKKTDVPDDHRNWAKSLESLYADLKAYVKEHHTQKLVWNPPKTVKSVRKVGASDIDEGSSGRLDSVTAFRNLISGPLAEFVRASDEIGGEVSSQASAFAGAWEAEAEFLEKVSKMGKPDDFQEMLAPIAGKMGEVGAIAEKVGPREAFSQHCQAVGESVGALGWVAVDEKATSYVGDMAGAGQFFVNKVKMGAKKTDKPDAHRAWAKALESLFAELKAYVKEYHTQKLVWNTN